MTASGGPGYQHHALLYDSPEELLAAAVPFLAAGLAAAEASVLTCREEHNALLTEALSGDDRIVHLPREQIYTRNVAAVAAYRRMVHRQVAAGAPRIRLVGEVPIGAPETWAEWIRFEAICNIGLAPLPLSSVCAYDTRNLPEPVRRGIEQTHPALLTARGPTPNDRYTDPTTVVRRTAARRPDPVGNTVPVLHLADLTDLTQLPQLRAQLRAALGVHGRHAEL